MGRGGRPLSDPGRDSRRQSTAAAARPPSTRTSLAWFRMTTSLQGGGHCSRPVRQRKVPDCRDVLQETLDAVPLGRVRGRRQTSRVPANARQSSNVYPFRTREALWHAKTGNTTYPIYRDFMSKPSDGLEPSTPSLPWSVGMGSAGSAGTPRAGNPHKKEQSPDDERPRMHVRARGGVPSVFPSGRGRYARASAAV
jgi:hypothetical protein